MTEPTLLEFANGGRFRSSFYACPQCGGLALSDNWPPNYGGGQSGFG